MQPRRRLQDVQGSANLPVDVTRGRLAGLLGLIPDVLNFMGRSPMPTETFGETQYNPRPQLPYDTDFYLKNLPLAPTSRAGQVAGQAASFVPLNPAPLVRAGVAGAQALAPTAARMTEGFMQRQGFMPGVVPAQPSGLLTPEIPAPKPQAPVSDLGFYSAAEQAAMNLQRGKGTGQSFLNDLMKAPDVKKDELQYTGLDDFLKDKPNVTRQEVQDFIAGNRVDVKEKQLGEMGGMQARQIAVDDITETLKAGGMFDDDAQYALRSWQEAAPGSTMDMQNRVLLQEKLIYSGENRTVADFLDSGAAQTDSTKFASYTLPGGENYREILLTLPTKRLNENEARKVLGARPDAKLSEADISYASRKAVDEYKSSHFDEPNILAHMRVNDRIDADGKKMLLIEEVQSDWHQAGREKGYNTPQAKAQMQKKLDDLDEERKNLRDEQAKLEEMAMPFTSQNKDAPSEILDRWNIVSNRLNNLQREYAPIANQISSGSVGVPDAPFKDTWHQLALKRALKEAVDKGYDRIGLTTGAQQAKRYDLSKQLTDISYRKTKSGDIEFTALDLEGRPVIEQTVPPEKLSDFVGKEMSQKMINNEGKKSPYDKNTRYFEGLDLQIGGEGMKKYYDEIYPAFLNKQGKKYGAQVGEVEIGLPPKTSNSWAYFRDWFTENHGNVGSSNTALSNWEQGANNKYVKQFEKFRKAATQTEKVRYLDITPEMRKAVQKGQPLFTAAPIGGIGTGLLSDEQRKELSGLLGP
jgi:hypothetical protein